MATSSSPSSRAEGAAAAADDGVTAEPRPHSSSALPAAEVPDLPDPAIKAICSFLPIASRTHARLVCTAWRRLAGEAVTVVGFTASQLKSQALSNFSRKQVRLQLAKAAAAEAAAAGGSTAAQRAAAIAAAAAPLAKPGAGTSSSSGAQAQQQQGSSSGGLRQRRGGEAAADSGRGGSSTARKTPKPKSSVPEALSQGDLNALGLAALSRRVAAAFPCATTAVVELSVGDYAQYAAPAPEQVASKLLLLLSACSQMARLRLSLTAVQQPDGGAPAPAAAAGGGAGNAAAGGAGVANGPAAAGAAAQNGVANDDSDEESDEESDVGGLGFSPEDADYCYGWLARLLQELTLQQEQQSQARNGSAWQYQWAVQRCSSGSWQRQHAAAAAAAAQRRQLLHPVLAWQPHELQQQQQPSQVLWAAADAAAAAAPAGAAGSSSGASTHTVAAQLPPLVLEVMITGAAFPRDAADWQAQLAPLASLAVLLLPPERPRLLPCMLSGSTAPGGSGGLAALTQLRALQLSVDAGYHAPHLAFEWGLVPPHPEPNSLHATASSSNLVALSRLSRLTHLALHASGAAAADMAAALMPLRRLRELMLSGSSGAPLPLPAVVGAMRELQLLVVQQQVTLHDMSLLAARCPKLKFLEVIGLADANGAVQGLLPSQVLLRPSSAVQLLSYASECADVGLLLGPAADAASKQYPGWLLQHPGSSSSSSSGSGQPWTHPLLALTRAQRRLLPHGIASRLARIAASAPSSRKRDGGSSSSSSTGLLLHWVSLTFLSEAEGVAGQVATEAARLLASLQQQQQRDATRRLPQQLFRQERSSRLVTALSVADVADALRSTSRDVDAARASLSAAVVQVQAAHEAAAARGAAPPEPLPGAALQKLQGLQRQAQLQAQLLRWWPALCAAQEQLQQAVWGLLQQRLAAAAPFHATNDAAVAAAVAAAGFSSNPTLCFTSLKEPTPSTATLALLQLVATCAPLHPQHPESGPMLPLVADDMMPAGAVGDLLDHLLNAAPFHSPTDASEEQQAADLAEETGAAAAWRLQQHRHQQHDDANAGGSGNAAAAATAGGGPGGAAAGSPAAAAAAAGPASPAGDGSHAARAWGLPGWSAEDSLLHQQQWLLAAYSSSEPSEPATAPAAAAADVAGSSNEEDAASQFLAAAAAALAGSSSSGEAVTRVTTRASAAAATGGAGSSSSQLRRLVMCVSSGADLSTLLRVVPGLKALTLTIPPSLLGARGDEELPEDDADTTSLLPQLQLWLGFAGLATTAAAAGNSGGSSSGSSSLALRSSQQQQYERWLVAVAGGGAAASFAGSFLAGPPAAPAAAADATSGEAGPAADSSSAAQPAPAAGLALNPSCCFVHLTELTLSNLTRSDGPWEPAATIGDAALAAAALGCPALKKLDVSGVLSITGAGLLLLRRLQRLTSLRLEQWTNTYNKVSEQQLVLPLACLPHALTSLSLLHIEPDTVHTPLAALAAAVAAAGGPAAVAAAAGAAAAAAAAGAVGVAAALQPAAVRRAAVLVLAAAGKMDSAAAADMLLQQHEQSAVAATSKRSAADSSSSSSESSSSSSGSDDDGDDSSAWETDDDEPAEAADSTAASPAAAAGRTGAAGAVAAGGEQQGPWAAFLGFGVGVHAAKPYERVMARSRGGADDASSHDGGDGHAGHHHHHHHHHHHEHQHEEGDGGEQLSVPVIGCRQWLPPAAIALLLLDAFVLSSSRDAGDGEGGVDAVAAAVDALRTDTSCCSERCCVHGSSRSCGRRHTSDGQQEQEEDDSSSSSSTASLVPAPQGLAPKPCCLAPVFQGLEDFSLISHGTGYTQQQQEQSAGGTEAAGGASSSSGRQAIGGVHAALVAGLPHAGSTLRRLHIATPGAFADAGHKEGFLHGVLAGAHALSCGVLTSGAAALVAHAAAAGLWDRAGLLHPLGAGLATLWPRGDSSSGGTQQPPGLLAAAEPPAAAGSSSGNRLSASYSWLRGLGEMPALREVHLDMPLSLPGQLDALAAAVGSSSSIVTLRLHGVALSPFSTQHSLLRSLARISPAAAALLDGSSGSSSSSWRWLWQQRQQQGPSAAEQAGGGPGAQQQQQQQTSQSNPLQLVDISFTKQAVLPPAALTMSRLLADMREQQQKWHQLRRLEALQRQHGLLSRLLGAVQGGALAGLGGGAAAGAGWDAAAAALAAAGGGGGAGGDGPMAWPPGLVEALLQGMQGDPQEQQDAAAAVAAAAAAGLPVPLEDNALPALVDAAAAFLALQAQQQEDEDEEEEEEQPQQGEEQQQAAAAAALPQVLQVLGPAQLAPLLRHLIMHLEQQMHLITHHSPPPPAPRAHTHAAAATAADRALAANLAWLLRTAGVADVTIRMHGARSPSSGGGVAWKEEDEPSEQGDDDGGDDGAPGQPPGGGGGSSWGPRARGRRGSDCDGGSGCSSDDDGSDEDGGDAASAQFWANVAAGFVGGSDTAANGVSSRQLVAPAGSNSSSRSRGLVNPGGSIIGSSAQAVADAASLLVAAFAAWCAFGIRAMLILEPLVLMMDPGMLLPQLAPAQRGGGSQDSSSSGGAADWWARQRRRAWAALRHGAKVAHGLFLVGIKVAMASLLLLIAAALSAQDVLQRVLGVGAAAGARAPGVSGALAAVSTAVAAAAGAVLGGRDSTQQLLLPLLQDLGLPQPRATALLARLSAALPHHPTAVLDGVLGLQDSLAPAGQRAGGAASDADSDSEDDGGDEDGGQHGEQLAQQEDLTGVPSEVQVLANVRSPAGRGFVAGAALAAWPLLVAGLWVAAAEARWLWRLAGRPLLFWWW